VTAVARTVAVLAFVLGTAAFADDRSVLKALEDAFVEIGESVSPCVVNIEVSGMSAAMREMLRDMGFSHPDMDHPPIQQRHSASGIIYDSVGNIITNNHVIDGADDITVTLSNGESYDARIVGGDPDTDIAVIRIDPVDALTPATFGDSDTIRAGQFAIAVGSARGLSGSMSFGHITGLSRSELAIDENLRFQDFIQTDAAINLGNSGGPLCNIDGEVIGINTAIVPDANAIGFAIPVNMAKRFVPELIARGKVMRGYLGVQILDLTYGDEAVEPFPSSDELVKSLDLPDKDGAYVQGFSPDSPAERAGVREGDVIRSINGTSVRNGNDLIARIAELPPGSIAYVEVWRRELGQPGAPVEIRVKLDEYPGSRELALLGKPILGMYLRNLTDIERESAGLSKDDEGLFVVKIVPGGPAAEKDIGEGDIILEVAQEPVNDPAEFRRLIEEKVGKGDLLHLRVLTPEGETEPRVLRVPDEP
jgi:serine protease Do